MDSERMTGAYRFDITPGEQTTTHVQARIFMRPAATSGNSAAVATLGIAPLTSMFFPAKTSPGPATSAPRCTTRTA
jgi:glucans biosynthesis protein